MTDELLIAGCLRQDPRLQESLYQTYRVELFTVCLRYASHRAEAEDYLQDGFAQIFRDLKQFDASRGSLSAWMRKVLLNKILQQLRKKKLNFVSLDGADCAAEIPADDRIISALAAKEIVEAIQRLPNGYRLVFNLFLVEGYSHQEIAKQLGISENTSKSQLRKARLALQQYLIEFLSA